MEVLIREVSFIIMEVLIREVSFPARIFLPPNNMNISSLLVNCHALKVRDKRS